MLLLFPTMCPYRVLKIATCFSNRMNDRKKRKSVARLSAKSGVREILFARTTASLPDGSCLSIFRSFIFIDDYRRRTSIFSKSKSRSFVRNVFKSLNGFHTLSIQKLSAACTFFLFFLFFCQPSGIVFPFILSALSIIRSFEQQTRIRIAVSPITIRSLFRFPQRQFFLFSLYLTFNRKIAASRI